MTHSNQALNQLFEKIMALDIQERHLLRMGFGEKELDTEKVRPGFYSVLRCLLPWQQFPTRGCVC